MSRASSLSYRIRPNKAVDRELFLSLLSRLGATVKIEKYKYIGLGGPFLEDFRLLHARLGIDDMVCVEIEADVHLRQKFNRPVESIICLHRSLEDYLDREEFASPVLVWLDYNDPKKQTQQIETFTRHIFELPIGSIVRITLNANPSSLGKPDAKSLSVCLPDEEATGDPGENELQWRLERFKERLGEYYPSGLRSERMQRKYFGVSLLEALRLAVERESINFSDRKVVWALSTHYADGQPMVTSTVITVKPDNDDITNILKGWQYYSHPNNPLCLDMPALSTIERLTMESCLDPKAKMGYELPKSEIGQDPYSTFRKFYRVFPHFARIDL